MPTRHVTHRNPPQTSAWPRRIPICTMGCVAKPKPSSHARRHAFRRQTDGQWRQLMPSRPCVSVFTLPFTDGSSQQLEILEMLRLKFPWMQRSFGFCNILSSAQENVQKD